MFCSRWLFTLNFKNLISLKNSGIWLVLLQISLETTWASPHQYDGPRAFPGEYVIEVVSENPHRRQFAAATLPAHKDYSILSELGSGIQVVTSKSSHLKSLTSPTIKRAMPLDPHDNFCAKLLKERKVKSCSPNFELHADIVPNDTHWDLLWGLGAAEGIDAPSAWNLHLGSEDVVVAVIDTGVDYSHPDLKSNMWINHGETPGNGIDDDLNGYVDDYHGISFADSRDCKDDNGHGSHVAGTIGASGNNALGVAGVSWRVRIMAVKFLDRNGSGSLAGAINALNYVIAMKERGVNVRITNNSWGGGGYSQPLYNTIQRAKNAGILFVAAAGNESNNNDLSPAYPSSYDIDNVVSVAALTRNQHLAEFSNYGIKSVDIAAPGVSILSTVPGQAYQSMSGTSMAAPHVSGALALLAAAEPTLTNRQLVDRLYNTAQPLASLQNKIRTGRKLNVGRMLKNENSPLPQTPLEPPPCKYEVEPVPFNPNRSADQAKVVLQADELNYYRYQMPFPFPFHNRSVSSIYISPNGVVYTDEAPGRMDYNNGPNAPLNSIAALHTDLSATIDPYGVRVFGSDTEVTIYWLSKIYGHEGLGDAEVRLTLYRDGRMESHISLSTPELEKIVQRKATIGITGISERDAFTYASNNNRIYDKLGVRFSPQCSPLSPTPTIMKLEAWGSNKNNAQVRYAIPGRPLRLTLSGCGSGLVRIQASLNGKRCPGYIATEFWGDYLTLEGYLPKLNENYTQVAFNSVPGPAKSLRIQPNWRIQRHSQENAKHKLTHRRFRTFCSSLLDSLAPSI